MLWWIAATAVSYFVKGLCGFANTLIFTSILTFASNNIDISPVDLLMGFPANAIVVWRDRKTVDWRLCLPVVALVLLGSTAGSLLLKNVNAQALKVVFGAVVTLLGVEMLLREHAKRQSRPSRVLLVAIGLLSGILFGMFGVGALLAAYFSRTTQDSHAFKANLCTVFMIENVYRVVLYICMGILTGPILLRALMLAPFMLLGLLGGMVISRRLPEKTVKRLVIVVLILSGIALIAANL